MPFHDVRQGQRLYHHDDEREEEEARAIEPTFLDHRTKSFELCVDDVQFFEIPSLSTPYRKSTTSRYFLDIHCSSSGEVYVHCCDCTESNRRAIPGERTGYIFLQNVSKVS